MKKSIFFAAVAALFALASCQVDIIPVEEIAVDPVFTADIVTTRTTVNALSGEITWNLHDEVTITDESATPITVLYEVTEIVNGQATLTKKADEEGTLVTAPYHAVYGADPSTNQTYSSQAPSLPMSAVGNDDYNLNFTVTCGLLEINLTKPGESITSIAVSDGTNTYTLTCNPAVSIATGNTFYIALPAGNYTSFKFTNASADPVYCTKNIRTGQTFNIPVNTVCAIKFGSSSLDFGSSYPEGTLSGVFSVAADKKIRFSRGNLQYQASGKTWRFAPNQYDVIGANAGNTTTIEAGRATQSDWIDLFGWGTTGVNLKKDVPPYCVTSDWNDYSSKDGETMTRAEDDKSDWGVCMGDGWFTLTENEWLFLVGSTSPRATSKRFKSLVEVTPGNSVKGLLLMPDNWTGGLTATTNYDTWKALESAGGVFLPFDGRRETTTVKYTDQGYYWASNNANGNDGRVLFLKNDASTIGMQGNDRRYGASVRLVINN